MREFETGATRDKDDNKYDYEGFLSPIALERFAEYMHKHRRQADGAMRDSDNWQKGIPIEAYRKSLVRHVLQCWGAWRNHDMRDDKGEPIDEEEALCAIMFNVQGLLHELAAARRCGEKFESLARHG